MIIEHRASAVLYRFLKSKKAINKFILPINICPVVAETFMAAGVTIEYVDINNFDYCIDYQSVLNKLNVGLHLYSGILYNHTYGYENSPIDFFKKLKDLNPEFIIIDDKCLCQPTFIGTKFSDLTLYSTGYGKYVDFGIGGVGCVENEEKIMKFDKIILGNNILLEGGSFKCGNDFTTKIMELSKKSSLHKSIINEIYSYHFQDIDKLSSPWNNWRYNILLPQNSELLLKEIFQSGYFASKHYKPLNNNYPNSTLLYNHVINLFNDKYITPKKAEKLSLFIKTKLIEL
jgi:hypothetical protein